MYVPTDTNPVDVTPRLLSPNAFVSCEMWWKGPDFLHLENIDTPCQNFLRPGEVSEEQKIKTVLLADSEKFFGIGEVVDQKTKQKQKKWWIIVGLDRYRNRFDSRLMSGGFWRI